MNFKILEEQLYPKPRVIQLPDGRIFRVYGIRRVRNQDTRSIFRSAKAEWKLAGRWMKEIPLNSKVAIDLVTYLDNLNEACQVAP